MRGISARQPPVSPFGAENRALAVEAWLGRGAAPCTPAGHLKVMGDRNERKRGSASGSEKRQRDYVVTVRLNGAERADLASRADRAKLSVAALIRHQILDVAPPRQLPRPPVETEVLARLVGQLGRVGSDVRAIADLASQTTYVPDHDLRMLEALHTDLGHWGQAVIRAMGRGADTGDDH